MKATLRLLVTATNSGGSTEATSAATSPVLAALPLNTVQPTVTGILKLGEKLLAHPETWSGTAPITYTYQWQLCGALGLVGECKDIAGATKENFLLELLDVGLTMRVGVTAHNERGSVGDRLLESHRPDPGPPLGAAGAPAARARVPSR